MNMKHTILSAFENLPYFTTAGFCQIAGDDIAVDALAWTALYHWVKAGHLIALKRGGLCTSALCKRYIQEASSRR